MEKVPYLLWILFNIALYITFIVSFFKAMGTPQQPKAVSYGPYRPNRMQTGAFFCMLLIFAGWLIGEIENNQAKSEDDSTGTSIVGGTVTGGTTGTRLDETVGLMNDSLLEQTSIDAPALGLQLLSEGQGESNVISVAQWEAGFLWTQTNKISESIFSVIPTGAVQPTNWMSYGVSERVTLLTETNWLFSFGTGTVSSVYASSFGTLLFDFSRSSPVPPTNGIPDGVAHSFIAPLQTVMGIVPTNGLFSYAAGSNSALFTWGNVFLGRDTNCSATVQAEFYPSGDFTFRYHFPMPTNNYAQVTNFFIIGAQCGLDGETVIYTNALLAINPDLFPAFELVWKSLAGIDRTDPDQDDDGLSTADEFYKYRTDPRLWDTDADGLSDGREVALGTNPILRDSDNDGLVDGSDPAPLQTTSLSDSDNDGIPDAYEIHWFSGTNVINSLYVSYTNTGFAVGIQMLAGMNPTNAAPSAVEPANSLVSWNLFGAFACDFGQLCTNVIFERTMAINRHAGWQQYFISAKPDRAEPWALEGMTLEWADSGGTNGTATASPSGDSLRLGLSDNGPASLTLRLRANGSIVRSSKPLYLLAWSPEVTFNPSPVTGATNGFQCLAFLKGGSDIVQVTFDRSARPHQVSASAEEVAGTSNPFSQTQGLLFTPVVTGGDLKASPGVYGIPGAILSPTNAAEAKLIFTLPRLDFDGCSGGCETHLSYNASSNLYSRIYNYPLDSHCLWDGWHRDADGAWSCTCEPEFTLGDLSLEGWLSYTMTHDGDRASATVWLAASQIWEDEAWHRRTDTCGESGGDYLSDDGCGSCGGGCSEGNCDALEGDTLGSLSFRIPLGIPRKGQVSGFLWFRSDGPVTVTPSLFNLMMRADAGYSVSSNNNAVAQVICGDGRGRDVSLQEIAYGVRISVTNLLEGALDTAWDITNPGGDPSCVNFRRVTRLGNPRRDVTYTYSNGTWVRADNISQTREQLVISGDPGSYYYEDHILRDLANNMLSRTFTQYQRIGSGDNAVIRETQRAMLDATGSLMVGDFATYWTDDLHANRNGKPKHILGSTRPWSYQLWDDDGREILKAEQRNGSNMSFSGEPSTLQSLLQTYTDESTVTETSYAVLAGDTDHADDEDKPRTVSVWATGEGSGTLISRTWHVYTHVTADGMPAVTRSTIRAASASANMNSGLNAISSETTYAENDAGIPLLLRGRAASSTDEASVTTLTSYAFGTFDPTTRIFTEGGATNHVRIIRSASGALTQSLSVEDATQGQEIYSATLLVSDASVLDWETRAYDDKGRLRFSAYSDGTTATNHYSCCRLLWSQDREGKVTFRNATTGYDHLYYAMEDRSVSNLVGSAVYPVTRHWFDALGRETNTVKASSDGQLSGGNRAIFYPYGSSDRSVATDAHGNFTVTTTSRTQNYDQTVAGQYAVGASSPYLVMTTTQYRNGPTVTRREWDNKFTQETRATAFDGSGNRIESLAIQSSDFTGTITNSVTVTDFLGRTASVTTPLGVTVYTYATDRNRLIYTERTGGPAVERTDYHYDDSGEQIGTTVSYGTGLPEASSFSATSYETVSNEVWRVTHSSRVTDSVTNNVSTVMEQLTGLGSGIISRNVSSSSISAEVTATETAFDPGTSIRTTTTTTDSRTPDIQTSKYGYTLTSSGLDGSESFTYDSLAREAGRTLRDASNNLLSTVSVSYDGFGNVTTNAVAYGQATTPDVMTVKSYNSFGMPVSVTTLTQGQAVSVVTNGYDSAGALISQGGDTYPVTFGFDTAGRRTQLTTRYGATDASATTQWKFDPMTGLITNKLDAAGKGAVYTYTSDGRPLGTGWARGSWKENSYNSRGLISSSSYSDSSMDVTYTYNASGLPSLASNATGFATAYAYSDALVLTNETISGLDTPDSVFEIGRTFDARQRPSLTALSHNGTNISQVTYGYDSENRLATIGHVDASIEYVYNGNYMNAGTIALSNGLVFTRTFIRDPYRKHLINTVSNCVDSVSVHSTAYSHDLLSRRTNIIYTAQTGTNMLSCSYNARSEVTGVTIDTNEYAYIYDNLGNSLYTALNTVTNAYTINSLNQYKAVTNLLDVTGYSLDHDEDGNTTRINEHELAYDDENRLSLYLFAWQPGMTGTIQNAYFHDHLGRRVRKMVQDLRVDDPGGMLPPTYWWHTNEVTTFVYDGWNLIHEHVAHTNGTVDEIEYVWGLDLSGSLQGAGGVGGLLFEKRNGVIYIPCYDANGNITAYVDTNGTVRASYLYDAFGKTITQSGDMADLFRFRFSTKYFDADTVLYYYGYRYYSPMLQRWINRDPIEESGGVNLYGYLHNNSINELDPFGLTNQPGDFGWNVYDPSFYNSKFNWRIAYLAEVFGVYREQYVNRAKEIQELELRGGITKAEGIALRAKLKNSTQAKTPPEVEQILRAIVGNKKYELRSPTGSYNPGKTNQRINSTTAGFKYAGRIMIVIGIADEVSRIESSNNMLRQIGNSSSGMLGQIGGGTLGAALTRTVIALPVIGRVIPHPYVKAGVVIAGGLLGSALGDTLFRGTYEHVYDVYICETEDQIK